MARRENKILRKSVAAGRRHGMPVSQSGVSGARHRVGFAAGRGRAFLNPETVPALVDGAAAGVKRLLLSEAGFCQIERTDVRCRQDDLTAQRGAQVVVRFVLLRGLPDRLRVGPGNSTLTP